MYDLDNLDGTLMVTDRADLLDLAMMSREFSLSFQLTEGRNVTSEIVLSSSLRDLSDEILEIPDTTPGCNLQLRFYMEIADIETECQAIQSVLNSVWGPELQPVQSLSFIYGQEGKAYNNCIELKFKRQITEEQMEDIPNLLKHLLQSAEELEAL
jgi:hypothetical protein